VLFVLPSHPVGTIYIALYSKGYNTFESRVSECSHSGSARGVHLRKVDTLFLAFRSSSSLLKTLNRIGGLGSPTPPGGLGQWGGTE
jgi:hypothetical protein